MLLTPGTIVQIDKESVLLNEKADVLFVVARCTSDQDVFLLVISPVIGLAYVSFWDVIRMELEKKLTIILGRDCDELVAVERSYDRTIDKHDVVHDR